MEPQQKLFAKKAVKDIFLRPNGHAAQGLLLLLLLLHGCIVLVRPWPPSRPSSCRLFCVHVSSSLWHPSSSGPSSRRPFTLTLVFLHSYFLLKCSDINSLPPFPHSSSIHVPAISIFLLLFLLLCPVLHIIASPLHLFCSSSILLHILDQIFISAPSFPKYANFSHHLPLNTMLLSHTVPLVLLLFCTF